MKKELNRNIPEEIQKQIFEYGASEKVVQPVYRVAKRGKLDDEAFLSTYEEIISGQLPDNNDKYPRDQVGTYSTSVYTSDVPCKKFIRCLKKSVRLRKKYPYPVILKGKTRYGLTQLTCEREKNYPDKFYVDWWIYDGMNGKVVEDYVVLEEV